MSSTRPSNNYQMHLVQTTHGQQIPQSKDTFVFPRYSMDIHGIRIKLLTIRRANPPKSELVIHVRIMWYNCSISVTSFAIPLDAYQLVLIGVLPDGQLWSFREYLVDEYIQ